jgi:phage terminase large subunit
MARNLVINTAKVFEPLLHPARYKGAWGGRGSGKSHNFAEMMIEQCLLERGTRAVGIREIQKSLKESSKRLIEDKLQDFRLERLTASRYLTRSLKRLAMGLSYSKECRTITPSP